MNVLVKVVDGAIEKYPYSFEAAREDFPSTSFPYNVDVAALAEFGIFPVEFDPQPELQLAQRLVEDDQPTFRDGAWRIGWTVVEDPNVNNYDPEWERVEGLRQSRNNELAASDWTQLPDAPVNHEAWAIYRQALRDITDQPGWPDAIEWPTPPTA
jgi:hypothetical protein